MTIVWKSERGWVGGWFEWVLGNGSEPVDWVLMYFLSVLQFSKLADQKLLDLVSFSERSYSIFPVRKLVSCFCRS